MHFIIVIWLASYSSYISPFTGAVYFVVVVVVFSLYYVSK